MGPQRCANCHLDRPAELFDATRHDIYRTLCRPCWPARLRGERRCQRCRTHKPTAMFGQAKGGARLDYCLACATKPAPQKTCVVCRKTQDRALFPRNTENRARNKCGDCYKPLPKKVTCTACHKKVFKLHTRPALHDPSQLQCLKCYNGINQLRRCLLCKQQKPQQQFRRTQNDKVSTRCQACPPIASRNAQPKRYAKAPCLTCNKSFKTPNPNSRTKPPKFCSVACRALSQRRTQASCVGCLRRIGSAYLYELADGLHCLSCRRAKERGMIIVAKSQGTAAAIMAAARVKARRLGKKNGIGLREVERAMANDCYLCGSPMEGIDLVDPNGEVDAKNVVSLCSFCRQLRKKRSLEQIQQWALSVVQGLPSLIVEGSRYLGRNRQQHAGASRQVIVPGVGIVRR